MSSSTQNPPLASSTAEKKEIEMQPMEEKLQEMHINVQEPAVVSPPPAFHDVETKQESSSFQKQQSVDEDAQNVLDQKEFTYNVNDEEDLVFHKIHDEKEPLESPEKLSQKRMILHRDKVKQDFDIAAKYDASRLQKIKKAVSTPPPQKVKVTSHQKMNRLKRGEHATPPQKKTAGSHKKTSPRTNQLYEQSLKKRVQCNSCGKRFSPPVWKEHEARCTERTVLMKKQTGASAPAHGE